MLTLDPQRFLTDSFAASEVSRQSSDEDRQSLLAESMEIPSSLSSLVENGRAADGGDGAGGHASFSYKLTLWEAVVILINATVSFGFLTERGPLKNGDPYVYVIMGLHIFLMIFSVASSIALLWCSELRGVAVYHGCVGKILGPAVFQVTSFITALYCFAFCSYLLSVSADVLTEAVCALCDQFDTQINGWLINGSHCSAWYISRPALLVTSFLVFVMPFSIHKRVKYLRCISLPGVFLIVIVLCLRLYQAALQKSFFNVSIRYLGFLKAFTLSPLILMMYLIHILCVPVYFGLRNRSMKAGSSCILVCGGFSFVVYLLLMLSSVEPAAQIKGSDSIVGAVVGIFSALKCLLAYCPIFFCGRLAFDSLWISVTRAHPLDILLLEQRRRLLTAAIWFVASVLCAVLMPSATLKGINWLSAITPLICLVLPGCCFLLSLLQVGVSFPHLSQLRALVVLAVSFVVLAAFLIGVAVSIAIQATNS